MASVGSDESDLDPLGIPTVLGMNKAYLKIDSVSIPTAIIFRVRSKGASPVLPSKT